MRHLILLLLFLIALLGCMRLEDDFKSISTTAKECDSGSGWWYNCFFSVALGTSSSDIAYGVAVDSSGNVYAAGYTQGGLDGNTHAGGSDLFVVKYNSSGERQ